MTDYASEMAKLFGGACSYSGHDWTQQRYFDSTSDCYASEVALMSSLTSEAYKSYGFKVQYFVKKVDLHRDPLFGEDPLENIERRFEVNMYAESLPSLQKTYQLQGMVYDEIISCQCTIAHFDEASQYDYEDGTIKFPSYVPKIGDLIWMAYSGLYYEVINVKKFGDGSTFLAAPITYQFSLRVWKNDHQTVDAPGLNPDKMEDLRSYVELGETFNLDTHTDTIEKTSKVTAESDYLSQNEIAKEDVDQDGQPMDNVESHVEYERKKPLEEPYDPFDGW